MKLQLRLMTLVLAGFMVFAEAAPEKAPPEGRPRRKLARSPARTIPYQILLPAEDAVGICCCKP